MEMKIMQPITVGGITLKNRIMFPPLTTGYEERDGSIGEQEPRVLCPSGTGRCGIHRAGRRCRSFAVFSHAKAV